MTDETEADRGISPASGRKRPFSRRKMIGVILGVFALVMAVVFIRVPMHREKSSDDNQPHVIGQRVAFPAIAFERPAPPEAPPPPPPLPQAPAAPLPPLVMPDPRNMQDLRGSFHAPNAGKSAAPKMLTYGSEPAAGQGEGGAGPGQGSQTAVAYKASVVEGAKAGVMGDTSLTLMPGALRCILDSAIDSSLPGPVFCHLPSDVLSPSGVVLMEHGTNVVGDYKNNVQRGQNRIFTLSATAYTPNGVVVPLAAPMGDALGRTGLDGWVDTHMWGRFGGALMLMAAQGAVGALQSLSQQGSGNSYVNLNTGQAESVVSEVLRNTINIPDTVHKNPGEEVTILLTKPVSFTDAYTLRRR